jgi:hypothetical protein
MKRAGASVTAGAEVGVDADADMYVAPLPETGVPVAS